MAISNELSSDIAAAILAENKTPRDPRQLKDIILRVHCALQEMSEEARARRFKTPVRQARKATESRSS